MTKRKRKKGKKRPSWVGRIDSGSERGVNVNRPACPVERTKLEERYFIKLYQGALR